MTELPTLPAWAKTLQRRIRQRGIDFFILHGPGVRDLHPLGARRFGTIGDCLAQGILNDRSAIITYDRGAGIGFSDRDVGNDFKTVLKAYDKLGGTNLAQVQPRAPDRALQLIETYLRYQLTGNPRFSAAVIIDYGETVAPAGEPGQLPAEDRGAIVTLRRWASEPVFLQRSVTFCLLVETTATLSAALVSDARTFKIGVPVPDEQERYAYLAGRGSRPETFSVVDARRVAILTAGLTRLHLESLLADAELGTRETGGADSGVSERVFASLAAFMGDTRRRGKVIWFLMTSRPDLVPVDLKRQGRAEEHLALFPPATVAERVKVFDLLRQRLGGPRSSPGSMPRPCLPRAATRFRRPTWKRSWGAAAAAWRRRARGP